MYACGREVGELYVYVAGFFFFCNPTIEVVTFDLRGWCTLGVFLLPAFASLGHECQDLLSPCHGMQLCTDKTPAYTLIQKIFLGNGVRTHANSSPSTGGSEEQRWTDEIEKMKKQVGQSFSTHTSVTCLLLNCSLFQNPEHPAL